MLRGLVREQRHWGRFPQILKTKLESIDPNSKLVTIDMPGFGTEAKRKSPLTIPEIARDVRSRWLNHRGDSNEEWGILAISLGGMCAMSWVQQFPDDFKRFVLINSSANGLSPIYHRMRPGNYLSLAKIMASRSLESREKQILQITTNLKDDDQQALAKVHADYARSATPLRINAIAQMIAAIRFRPPEKISIPLLVLSAGGDTLVNPDCSFQLARHYGAPLIQHPSANHDLSTDDPAWLAEQVHAWLDSPRA